MFKVTNAPELENTFKSFSRKDARYHSAGDYWIFEDHYLEVIKNLSGLAPKMVLEPYTEKEKKQFITVAKKNSYMNRIIIGGILLVFYAMFKLIFSQGG